ncbi:MAG: biotin/lipoyl-containing protein [Limisphaerales bacterium]
MIKKLRVTVDGKLYEVSVEVPDDLAAPASVPPPFAGAPVSAPPPPSPSPTAAAPPPPASTGQTAAGPGEVRSPLAGRIIAINAQVGQAVKEGDHVVTVEAMKMNTAVTAPKAGKVAEILTTVGSAVDEGQVLLRIAS